MSKKLNIGLFGFGVVGQGLYDIIKTKNLNLEIVNKLKQKLTLKVLVRKMMITVRR